MKKTTIIITTLAFALALTSALALAGDSTNQSFAVGPVFGFQGSTAPNLTAEQSAQMQALRDSFFKETEPLRKELLEKEAGLRDLDPTSESTTTAVKARLNEISDLQAKLNEKISNHRNDVQRVLTSTSKPHAVIPGEIFQVDPEVDYIQMYGG